MFVCMCLWEERRKEGWGDRVIDRSGNNRNITQ